MAQGLATGPMRMGLRIGGAVEAGKTGIESDATYLSYVTLAWSPDFVWIAGKCRDFVLSFLKKHTSCGPLRVMDSELPR